MYQHITNKTITFFKKYHFFYEPNLISCCYNIRKSLNESLSIARNVIMIGLFKEL